MCYHCINCGYELQFKLNFNMYTAILTLGFMYTDVSHTSLVLDNKELFESMIRSMDDGGTESESTIPLMDKSKLEVYQKKYKKYKEQSHPPDQKSRKKTAMRFSLFSSRKK